MSRLPTPGGDDGTWGNILNDFLGVEHNSDGTLKNAVKSVNGKTPISGAVTLSKSDIGLGSVDNTSDANKPISTATSTALALKAPLASPALTGTPTKNGSPILSSAELADTYVSILDTPVVEQKLDVTRLWAANAATPMTIPTYDGSGQTVEPSVRYFPKGWNGHRWWMVVTPYPTGNDNFENPQAFYSDDGDTWTAVPGAPAPLFPMPSDGHNDDPEIILGPDNRLYMFIISAHPNTKDIVMMSTADGVTWTDPAIVLTVNKTVDSPIAVCVDWDRDANGVVQWTMWYTDASNNTNGINAPYPLVRRTATDPGGPWSGSTVVPMNGLPAGQSIWEPHIHRVGREFQMVTTTTAILGTGGDSTLHAGRSDDGLTFTINTTPLLYPSAPNGWDSNIIYRADFVSLDNGDDAVWDLFYSARQGSGGSSVWGSGRTMVRSGRWSPHPLRSVLAADTTPVNNSTVVVDSGLAITNATPAGVYKVKAFVIYNTSTVADLKLSLVLPTGASAIITPNSLRAAATGGSDTIQRQVVSVLTNIVVGGIGGSAVALIEGVITMGATAGTIKIQFAQSTLEVSDTKLLAGSYLELTRAA